jgi:hypothetical protein
MLKKKSGLKLRGQAVIQERDSTTGKILSEEIIDNLIVNAGLERVAKLLGGVSTDYYTHIAIGEGTTAATTGDTALESEATRAAATIAYEASYKCKFEKTFTVGSGVSYTITEAALTDDAVVSGSVILDRFVFSSKTLDASTNFYIRITITVS